MVDPVNCTNFSRDTYSLEEYAIFTILVANKPALRTAAMLDALLKSLPGRLPFKKLKPYTMPEMQELLKQRRFGCHTMKGRGLHELVNKGLDLKTCSVPLQDHPDARWSSNTKPPISEALKGKPKSESHKTRMSEAAQGKKLSLAHRAKIAEKMADRVFSEEHRRKISLAATGRTWTEEQKAKVRGKVMSPESRAKMSAAKMGKPWSEARRNVGHQTAPL